MKLSHETNQGPKPVEPVTIESTIMVTIEIEENH